MATRIKSIGLNGPVRSGAAYPKFNPKMVNESEYEYELRAKWMDSTLHIDKDNPETSYAECVYEAQECDELSRALRAELKRAAAANGLPPKCKISLRFGQRDWGARQKFTLTIPAPRKPRTKRV